jgi:hypothetical protein
MLFVNGSLVLYNTTTIEHGYIKSTDGTTLQLYAPSIVLGYQATLGATTITPVLTTSNTGDATFAGNVQCVTLSQTSDERFKLNIADASVKDSMALLAAVRPRVYQLRDDVRRTPHLGVVAQELEAVVPSLVHRNAAAGGDTMSVNYVELLMHSLVVVRQLMTEVADLKQQCHKSN